MPRWRHVVMAADASSDGQLLSGRGLSGGSGQQRVGGRASALAHVPLAEVGRIVQATGGRVRPGGQRRRSEVFQSGHTTVPVHVRRRRSSSVSGEIQPRTAGQDAASRSTRSVGVIVEGMTVVVVEEGRRGYGPCDRGTARRLHVLGINASSSASSASFEAAAAVGIVASAV